MPADTREDFMDDWYQNSGKLKLWLDYRAIDNDKPTGVAPRCKGPQAGFRQPVAGPLWRSQCQPGPDQSLRRCLLLPRPNIDLALQDAEQALVA